MGRMWRTRRCARQRSHCAKGEGSAPRGHEPRLSYYPPARKRFPKIIQTIRREFQRLFRWLAPPSQPLAFPHGKAGHHPLPMSRAQLHGRANFKVPITPPVSSPRLPSPSPLHPAPPAQSLRPATVLDSFAVEPPLHISPQIIDCSSLR